MPSTSVDDLRDRIAKRNVLAIVGAGVSIAATNRHPCASWIGLLVDGVQYCMGHGLNPDPGWEENVRSQIQRNFDTESLLAAAEAITKALGGRNGGPYRKWLGESVGSLRVVDSSVIAALHGLNVPLATTNYDGLLEEVTHLEPVSWRDRDKVEQVVHGDDQAVLHLHGYWDDPESVILGVRSYETVLNDSHAQQMLRMFAASKTLLFVGYGGGLDDPNFGPLLDWTREVFADSTYQHYRLGTDAEVEKLKEKNPHEPLIVPLSYGADHTALAPFLRSLAFKRFPGAGLSPGECEAPAEPLTGERGSAGASHSRKAPTKIAPESALPPPPRCIGRDALVKDLVQTLLDKSPPPTPLLGPAGIGKTTITLAALHDPRAAKRYAERRYFVRCDASKSRSDLIAAVALAMKLEPGPRLEDRVFQALAAGKSVLALDNAETPWEADRTAVEELFASLAAVQGLALVASVRGAEKPAGPSWRSAIRVEPIELEDARAIFNAITDAKFQADPQLDALLNAVDRVPLAVVLLAHAAESDPNLAGLWRRWQDEKTGVLVRGMGDDRLTNIDRSIEISRTSPRMTDEARRLLAVLAVLPGGLAHEDLGALLPGSGDRAANVLRKVGLAFDEQKRLRMLAPVYEYVARRHLPEPDDLARAVTHFESLARTLGPKVGTGEGASAVSRLAAETDNLEAMLLLGLESSVPASSIDAVCALADFIRYSGLGSPTVLERAKDRARGKSDEGRAASCALWLGMIALARSDHEAARSRYEEALPLFRRVGDVLGEASCIISLGEIELARSDHEAARARYEEALKLYRRVGDVLGEANCVFSLGDVALRRSDHEAARARYEEALKLYRRVGSVQGEANCVFSLGEAALARSDHEAARARYEEALPLFRRGGDVQGEANCVQGLGDIALARSDHDAARTGFEAALMLYERISEPYSIGLAHRRLARVARDDAERRRHVRAARDAWTSIRFDHLVEELREEFGELD